MLKKISLLSFALAIFSLLTFSCGEFELPGEGTLEDLTPPSAAFSLTPDAADYLTITFVNESISATTFAWDFGDGTTSNERNPTHTYAADGDYTISLTASDALGATSSTTDVLTLEEPEVDFEPVILNPGFDIEGDDSFRDGWRNSDLGGVIQITSSPIHDGEKAAKLPSAGDRIGYQKFTVLPNTEYTVSFYYTLKDSPVGNVTVSILNGDELTDISQVADATLGSFTGDDQSSPSDFVLGSVTFDSGDNSEVAIFFTNVGAEARVDSFTIVAN